MKKIQWNPEKSLAVQQNPDRGLSLELIAELIQNDTFIDVIIRSNYPDQGAFVLPIGEDVWCVPFREDEETIFLITAWPDRKLKKRYS